MHIICASYHNIGPFENQIITVFLKSGKYLIKAPIGSGKSFLFFDGLVYALYGYSKRDMLNAQSSEGRTKVLFEHDGELYLIYRPLSGKKGIKLYKYKQSGIFEKVYKALSDALTDVLSWGVDFSDYLDLNEFEVIEFHRVSEVQQHIDMILPPRSVFLQKSILMQDSENLFELLPKARIDVLKLLFGLDMIDSVRDQIGDKKNELRGQYKVLSESSHIKQQYDERYNEFVKTIQEVYDYLGDDIQSLEEAKMLHIFQTFIKDPLATYVDSLHYDLTQRDLSEWASYWNSMLASKISINEQISSLSDELNKLNGEYDEKKQKFMLLEQNVRKINPQQHQTHTHKDALEILVVNKKQKTELLKEINESIPDSARTIFGRYMIECVERTLPVFQSSIDQLTQLGKIAKSELETWQAKSQIFDNKLQSKSKDLEHAKQQLEMVKQELRRKHIQGLQYATQVNQQAVVGIQKQREMLDNQKQSLLSTIDSLQKQFDSQTTFFCTKIEANCPFVDKITQGSFDKFTLQITQNRKQLQAIDVEIDTCEKQLLAKQQELLQSQSSQGSMTQDQFVYEGSDYTSLLHAISLLETGDMTSAEKLEQSHIIAGIGSLTKKLEAIRDDYKMLAQYINVSLLNEYHQLSAELKEVDMAIMLAQSQLQTAQEDMMKFADQQQQLITMQQDLTYLQGTLQEKQEKLKELNVKAQGQWMDKAEPMARYNKKIELLIAKAKDLYKEKVRIEDDTKKIKEELSQANLLHTIFGKELTLYVLQSYIPLLNEYINAFLAKVVNFQIRITVSPDGDELELMIEDELGTREAKSLSGGQKTILRLCRILASSVVFKNTFLLLDETINNIDTALIAKVAELLTDYVKQYNLTFYTVTHSEQIQQMSIRDEIVEIQN